MTEATANPVTGAGSDLHHAASQIRGILGKPEPAKASQPAENTAPVQANQQPADRLRDPVTKRFVKAQEPGTAEDKGPKAEGEDAQASAQPDAEGQTADTSQPDSDTEELADTPAGLAAQLGMTEEELLDHLGMTVKVKGEEKRVNLRELRSGFMMETDYRQKTAEIAEARRAFEAEQSAYQQQREHLSSQLQPLVQQLGELVRQDDALLDRLLSEGRTEEYLRAKHDADQRRAQFHAAHQEQQRIAHQQAEEQQRSLERDVVRNEDILAERFPEWAKNPEEGRKAISGIRTYLKEQGVPAKQADSLYDAVSITLADKAMKWDKLQKEKPSKLNEVRQIPKKFQKPGASQSAEDPKKQVLRASLNRLRRTGSTKDAAMVFKNMGLIQRS